MHVQAEREREREEREREREREGEREEEHACSEADGGYFPIRFSDSGETK